jgi:hypothetical protein
MKLTAPDAGTFVLRAKTFVPAPGAKHHRQITFGGLSTSVPGAGPLTITVKPSAAARRALRAGARLKVILTISFTPSGGAARTETAVVRIQARH